MNNNDQGRLPHCGSVSVRIWTFLNNVKIDAVCKEAYGNRQQPFVLEGFNAENAQSEKAQSNANQNKHNWSWFTHAVIRLSRWPGAFHAASIVCSIREQQICESDRANQGRHEQGPVQTGSHRASPSLCAGLDIPRDAPGPIHRSPHRINNERAMTLHHAETSLTRTPGHSSTRLAPRCRRVLPKLAFHLRSRRCMNCA